MSGRDELIKDFRRDGNITRNELQDWLGTPESKRAGIGSGESKGHRSGRRIVDLLGKKKADFTEDDGYMRRVHGYVKRHLAGRPQGDIEASTWRHSLMNWGHDPLK
ncbi:MAG: DUF3140 domain-containing protein [Solirubrobacterales bacterium]|nr:DUF3140 domain-containing protein [Solirubrobacterales bacterium]MBV9916945.1 DUF3140 domain-containing protein [Solirubrobacterales bacterium]